jgi:uncharacterized protein (TIGR01777 family)
MKKKRIVIAGGSGFIGTALAHDWYSQNGEVVVLTRKPQPRKDGVIEVEWSGEHMGEWMQYLDGAEAVINLTGKNVNCRHTPENIREMTESRVQSVRAIGLALGHVKTPPRVWIQAGAIGYYGNTRDRICDETALNGAGVLADICRQWESAFNTLQVPKTRKVLFRIGFVLGRYGGAMPVLTKLTKWFLGGHVGDGKQYVSWIHLEDLLRMFWGSMDQADLTGTYNAVGPNPVRNDEFMRELRHVLNRPWSPPAPKWAVKLGAKMMGSEADLALDGCRAAPKRLLDAGFQFDFPDLPVALKNVFSPGYAAPKK